MSVVSVSNAPTSRRPSVPDRLMSVTTDDSVTAAGAPIEPNQGGAATQTLVAQAIAPTTPTGTSLTGRPPQRQQDGDFRFFDDTTGATVRVRLPVWKDDNHNAGGYFTLDRNGKRYSIDAWSPAAALGGRGEATALKLLQGGGIDPRNIEIVPTHRRALGGDGREYWLPVARKTREDGVALYFAMQKAQIPTDGSAWMRQGDLPAFRQGFTDARRGEAFLQGYQIGQTALGIAALISVPIAGARQKDRGDFELQDAQGRRLKVSMDPSTGKPRGEIRDSRGRLLNQEVDSKTSASGSARSAEPSNSNLPGVVSKPIKSSPPRNLLAPGDVQVPRPNPKDFSDVTIATKQLRPVKVMPAVEKDQIAQFLSQVNPGSYPTHSSALTALSKADQVYVLRNKANEVIGTAALTKSGRNEWYLGQVAAAPKSGAGGDLMKSLLGDFMQLAKNQAQPVRIWAYTNKAENIYNVKDPNQPGFYRQLGASIKDPNPKGGQDMATRRRIEFEWRFDAKGQLVQP